MHGAGLEETETLYGIVSVSFGLSLPLSVSLCLSGTLPACVSERCVYTGRVALWPLAALASSWHGWRGLCSKRCGAVPAHPLRSQPRGPRSQSPACHARPARTRHALESPPQTYPPARTSSSEDRRYRRLRPGMGCSPPQADAVSRDVTLCTMS